MSKSGGTSHLYAKSICVAHLCRCCLVKLIAGHLHALGYSTEPDDHKKCVKMMSKKHERDNPLRKPWLVSTCVKDTEGDVALVAGYWAKPVYQAKRVTPSKESPGDYMLRDAPIPQFYALRIAEILSYFSMRELIVTRSRAAGIWCHEAFASMGHFGLARPAVMLDESELNRLWCSVWDRHRRPYSQRPCVLRQAFRRSD